MTTDIQSTDHDTAAAAFQRVFEAIAQDKPEAAAMLEQGWASIQAADVTWQEKVAAMSQALAETTKQHEELIEDHELLLHDLEHDPHGSDNRLIERFVQSVRDDLDEHFQYLLSKWKDEHQDDLVHQAQEEAEDEIRGEIAEQIAEVLDIDTYEAETILEMLTGQGYDTLSDDHARQFNALANQIEDWNRRERMKSRAAVMEALNQKELSQDTEA